MPSVISGSLLRSQGSVVSRSPTVETTPPLAPSFAIPSTPLIQPAIVEVKPRRPGDNVVRRMHSTRLPTEINMTRARELDDSLNRDLINRINRDVSGLSQIIFPDEKCCGFNIDVNFLTTLPAGILEQNIIPSERFHQSKHAEQYGALYLNEIIALLTQHFKSLPKGSSKLCGATPKRYWTAAFADTLLPDDTSARKPDIVLVDIVDGMLLEAAAIRWPNVYAVAELTKQDSFHANIKQTIVSKSYLMLLQQGDRNFSISLGIYDHRFRIGLMDREGQVMSQALDFSQASDCCDFIRMIIGLSFADKSFIGLDDSMERYPIPQNHISRIPFDKEERRKVTAALKAEEEALRTSATTSARSEAQRHAAGKAAVKDAVFPPGPNYPYAPYQVNNPPLQLSSIIGGVPHNPSNTAAIVAPADKATSKPARKAVGRATSSIANSTARPFNILLPPSPPSPPQVGAELQLDVRFIHCDGVQYEVVQELYRSQGLVGRATRVWLVIGPDKESAIVKESWILQEREQEAEFLSNLVIPNGVQCLASSVGVSTSALRFTAFGPKQHREKRRVITRPCGRPITGFRTLFELLGAILDVVKAIEYLESQGKAHRDISVTNILLRAAHDGENDGQLSPIDQRRKEKNFERGLLIDFDYAAALRNPLKAADPAKHSDAVIPPTVPQGTGLSTKLSSAVAHTEQAMKKLHEEEDYPTSGVRTGTAPFMAIDLLLYASHHTVAHDLESLFYVLLFICTNQVGPNNLVRRIKVSDKRSTLPISEWFHTEGTFEKLGYSKFSHVHTFFETAILANITPYFEILKPMLRNMHYSLFDALNPFRLSREDNTMEERRITSGFVTCTMFIDILETTMADPAIITADPVIRHPADPPSLETLLASPKLGKRSRANSSRASSGNNKSLDDMGKEPYKRLRTQLAHFPIPRSSSSLAGVTQSSSFAEPVSRTSTGYGSGSGSVQGGNMWNA